jgi:hypothetical protein
MKKVITFIFLLFISILTFSQDFDATSREVIKNFDGKFYKTLKGHMYLRSTVGGEIMLLISSTTDDKLIDNAIILQFEDKELPKLENQDLGNSEVFIFSDQRSLVLHTGSDNILLLGLDEELSQEKSKSIQSNENLNFKLKESYLSFGISVMQNDWSYEKIINSSDKSAYNQLTAARHSGAIELMYATDDCTSGGVGSSECSITEGAIVSNSCSVKCNAGYYACCSSSTTSCKCKKG